MQRWNGHLPWGVADNSGYVHCMAHCVLLTAWQHWEWCRRAMTSLRKATNNMHECKYFHCCMQHSVGLVCMPGWFDNVCMMRSSEKSRDFGPKSIVQVTGQ